ncbi:WecB/TagA/CpsF family glycosyltransferase [Herbaspirillum sp. AP02]|uniref:WecB/TagA/CpsF family glycosyltransferase n=1 Tax=unclassified Herbaspirillum TaxID=2624150 RepID=UPI0015DA8B2B|nr:WecB/TagA/CpsF family glycosyltransferase [Herbaspirillum sp. AP02]NZD68627.1 WecB/TagA/CpsF family glycosyltransferase [Herbaspirillum sp. AP21]
MHLPDFNRDVFCILGLPFDRVSLADAERITRAAVERRQRCFLSTPNLNFAIACLEDPQFRLSVIQSDLSIADGMPLIWIARATGLPLNERVAGSSLFQSLRQATLSAGSEPMRVYFFGGPPGVAKAASEKLNASASAMTAVGFDSPGFGTIEEMSDTASIERINASGADFLVVALGAKKGQAWIQYNLPRLRVPLVSHLGAVVNFVAGTVSRAPVWAQKTGLEWLWRIKEEPKLWRRYWDDGVGLLTLLVDRVFPLALAARRQAPVVTQFEAAHMAVEEQEGDCILRLSGAVGQANIGRLRALLPEAARSSSPLVVDCTALVHLDSAALASLMLLYGACRAAKRPWAVLGVSPELRKQFGLHCAEYLLQPSA